MFFKKIEKEFKKNNYKFQHNFVDYYYKDEVDRKITLFEKPLEFENQKEFRFYVENDKIEPTKLQIGSLKKYTEIFKIEDLCESSVKRLSLKKLKRFCQRYESTVLLQTLLY